MKESDAGKQRLRELREWLLLERVGDIEQLSPDEQRLASGENDGALEIETTRVLGAAPPPAHALPEPTLEGMLTRAAKQHIERTGVATGRAHTPRRWALATFSIAASAGIALALLLWPGEIVRNGNGENAPAASGLAWASVDGYVIELDLVYPKVTKDANPEELTDHPVLVFQQAIADWQTAHQDEAVEPGHELLEVKELRGQYPWLHVLDSHRKNEFSLVLFSTEENLLADLLAVLRPLPGLSQPRVYQERLYYSDKFPEIYAPERKIIANGTAYRFPEEIDERYIKVLHNILSLTKPGKVQYRAFFNMYNSRRAAAPLVTGDVIKEYINSDGDLVLETYLDKWNHDGERQSCYVSVDEAKANAGYDPVPELRKQLAKRLQQIYSAHLLETEGIYSLQFALIPSGRWCAGGEDKLTDTEITHSSKLAKRMQAAFDTWLDDHAAKLPDSVTRNRSRLLKQCTFGEAVILVELSHSRFTELQVEELTGLLEIAGETQAEPLTWEERYANTLGTTVAEAVDGDLEWVRYDGYILEYEALACRRDPATNEPLSNPVSEIINLVDQWSLEQQPEDIFLENPLIAQMIYTGQRDLRDNLYLNKLSVYVIAPDQELVDDLAGWLAPFPGLSTPDVFQGNLYCEKSIQQFTAGRSPELFVPGRKVTIDGTEHAFPVDFNYLEIQDIIDIYRMDPDSTAYRAYWNLGAPATMQNVTSRFDLGDITRLEFSSGNDLVITTLVEDCTLPPGRELHGGMLSPAGEHTTLPPVNMHHELVIPRSRLTPEVDPLQLLADKALITDQGLSDIVSGDDPLYLVKFPLFPVERWLAEGTEKFNQEDAVWSRKVFTEMQAAFDGWLADHPELVGNLVYRDAAHLGPLELGDVVFCAKLRLNTADPALADELIELLQSTGNGLDPLINYYPDR